MRIRTHHIVALLFALPAAAVGQNASGPFDELARRLKPGARVSIDLADGRVVKGKITDLSPSALEVLIRSGDPGRPDETRVLTGVDVRRVVLRDSVWNGAILGSIGGAILGALPVQSLCQNEGGRNCPEIIFATAAMTGALGAAVGAGVDGLWHGVVYDASRLSASTPGQVATGRTIEAGPGRNSVFLELLGNGGLYSFNFDHTFPQGVGVRLAAGAWSAPDLFGAGETQIVFMLPMVNYLRGRAPHQLEIGAGVMAGQHTFLSRFSRSDNEQSGFATLTGVVGYRYQRSPKGFVFRVGFTPLIGLGDSAYPDSGFFPSFGTSLGYGW